MSCLIREAGPGDLASIAPFSRAIVAAGETYAYPEDFDDAGNEVVGWALAESYHGIQFNAVVETNTAGFLLGRGFDGTTLSDRRTHRVCVVSSATK